jgi:DNA modification methylase
MAIRALTVWQASDRFDTISAPETRLRPAMTNTNKLRRQRKFAVKGSIQSQLPNTDLPHSRRYTGKSLPASGVLNAPEAGLGLDDVTDRIVCGDTLSVLRQLPDDWCAAAITSPPYWHTVDYGVQGQIGLNSYEKYLDDLDLVWAEIARVLLPNGKFCLNVPILPLTKDISEAAFGPSHTRVLLDLYSDMKQRIERTSLQLFSLYVWEKQTTEKMFGSYPFPPNLYERNYIEFIVVFVKPGLPRVLPPEVKEFSKLSQADWLDLTQQIWWMYPENVPRLEGHPAPFPEALPNRLIAMYTFRSAPEHNFAGDFVLDPFVGSGTTCVAARRLGRRFVGIDLNAEFAAFAQHRVAASRLNPRIMSGKRPVERESAQMSFLKDTEHGN